MSQRLLQVIARLQQADQVRTEAMNLLLQELAEAVAPSQPDNEPEDEAGG